MKVSPEAWWAREMRPVCSGREGPIGSGSHAQTIRHIPLFTEYGLTAFLRRHPDSCTFALDREMKDSRAHIHTCTASDFEQWIR